MQNLRSPFKNTMCKTNCCSLNAINKLEINNLTNSKIFFDHNIKTYITNAYPHPKKKPSKHKYTKNLTPFIHTKKKYKAVVRSICAEKERFPKKSSSDLLLLTAKNCAMPA